MLSKFKKMKKVFLGFLFLPVFILRLIVFLCVCLWYGEEVYVFVPYYYKTNRHYAANGETYYHSHKALSDKIATLCNLSIIKEEDRISSNYIDKKQKQKVIYGQPILYLPF